MDNKKKNPNFKKSPFISFLIFSVIATILLNYFMSSMSSVPEEEIYYNEFMDMIAEEKVEEV